VSLLIRSALNLKQIKVISFSTFYHGLFEAPVFYNLYAIKITSVFFTAFKSLVYMQISSSASDATLPSDDALTSVDDVTVDVTGDAGMTFMAVKDYDPRYFSQSGGRTNQELILCEGDIVRQLGMLA